MRTFSAKAEQVDRKWWIIDARDQVLGRVAVKAANLLRGKEKAIVTPHVDTGDFVVVINADKVRLTGKKEEQKSFMSFSGFVGGHKSENVARPPGAASRALGGTRRARNDSTQQTRPGGLSETQGLPRRRASPRRAATANGCVGLTKYFHG